MERQVPCAAAVRLKSDPGHKLELAAFFCFRLAELAARVTLLALFAVGGSAGNLRPLPCARVARLLSVTMSNIALCTSQIPPRPWL